MIVSGLLGDCKSLVFDHTSTQHVDHYVQCEEKMVRLYIYIYTNSFLSSPT